MITYALEHARSGRSHCTGRCRKEGKLIPYNAWRFGSCTDSSGQMMTFWRCLKCVTRQQLVNVVNVFEDAETFLYVCQEISPDELPLFERYFELTLDNNEETAEERLAIIRELNQGLGEEDGEQEQGQGGGERKVSAEEAIAAAAAAGSAKPKAKGKGNGGKRKVKKDEPEEEAHEEEEGEEEEEDKDDDEETVSIPVKRAATKKPVKKPTELEVIVLKAVLAEGGVADMQTIHKNAAELLGIANYKTRSINSSVTRAVGKGLLSVAEVEEQAKKEEEAAAVGGVKSGEEEEGEEAEMTAGGRPRRRRAASKKKLEALVTITVYSLTARAEQILGGGPVEEGAAATAGAGGEPAAGKKKRGRKPAVVKEEEGGAEGATAAVAAAGGGGGGMQQEEDAHVEAPARKKAKKVSKSKGAAAAAAAAAVGAAASTNGTDSAHNGGGGGGGASSSSGGSSSNGTASAAAYGGAAVYGGGVFRRKSGAVVEDARLSRALSQRFACMSAVLRGAGGVRVEGTDNPSGIFEVASFNSGSVYTVTFAVASVGQGGAARKCVGRCTCPDFRKRGSQYACKHQLFVAVRVLGMTPDVLHAGEGLPVAEFALALSSDRLAHLRIESFAAAASAAATHFAPTLKGPAAPQKPLDAEAECAICYEVVCEEDGSHDPLSYCVVCGQSVHSECQGHWNRSSGRGPGGACVYCRSVGTVKAAP